MSKTIKQQFFNSLKRGTGEAYLIVRDNPSLDFSAYIIKGALKNYAYDGQAESSRAQYIFDIVTISSQKDKIYEAILKGLESEEEHTWSLTQLFELVKLYALQGDNRARQAIYDKFFSHSIRDSYWAGSDEILELDGSKGLLFIADKIGKYLTENPDDWQDSNIIERFTSDNPGASGMEILQKEALSNNNIKLYLDNIARTKQSQAEHQSKRPSYTFDYSGLLDYIRTSKGTYIPPRFTKNLSVSEIEELATHFLKEKDPVLKEKYLSIFTRIKFPFDYKPIFDLVKRKHLKGSRLAEFAIDSLQYVKADEIRVFALNKLSNTNQHHLYTNLLISNYLPGDSILLKTIAEKAKSEHIIENLAISYIDIYSANKTKECLEPLLILYKKMNCGIHRNSLVEILIENGVVPDYINAEIEFDSYEATRQLHKK